MACGFGLGRHRIGALIAALCVAAICCVSAAWGTSSANAVERTGQSAVVMKLVPAKNQSDSTNGNGPNNGFNLTGGNASSNSSTNSSHATSNSTSSSSSANGGSAHLGNGSNSGVGNLADTGVSIAAAALSAVLLVFGAVLSCRHARRSRSVAALSSASAAFVAVSLMASLGLVGVEAQAAAASSDGVSFAFDGEAQFNSDNSVSVPALKVSNHLSHDVTITAVTLSDGLTWSSQAVGKTVHYDGGTLQAGWLAPTAIPASLANKVKDSASQSKDLSVKIAYSYDDAHVVKWDANGGDFSGNASSVETKVEQGDAVSNSKVPTRVGYTFEGWNVSKNGSGDSVTANGANATRPKSNVTYYARWKACTYSVSYVLNDGAVIGVNPKQYTYGVGIASFYNPHRAGYRFDGWYDNSGFTGARISRIDGTRTGAVTLYAKWAQLHTVTFEANGGDPAPSQQTVADGDKARKPAEPSKTGYDFAGWFTDNNTFDNEFNFDTDTVGSGMTLYAKWTPKTYAITYELNQGANADANPTSYTYGIGVNSFVNPIRSLYSFVGWYGDASFAGEQITSISATQTGEMTLYAKWEKQPTYTLNWQAGDGHFVDGQSSTTTQIPQNANRGINTDEVPADPVRDNYKFMGWYTQESGKGNKLTVKATRISADTTYYAYWVEVAGFWMEPANADSPTESKTHIDGHKTAAEIVADVKKIREGDAAVIAEYTEYMHNDSPHLYAKIGTGTGADDYLEMRIIQVGQHDDDGSALTFQAVHAWPTALRMNTKDYNQAGYWQYDVHRYLRGERFNPGPFWNMLPSGLSAQIIEVYKEYTHNDYRNGYQSGGRKFTGMWVLGYFELFGAGPFADTPSDGSQYAFWKDKGVTNQYPEYKTLSDFHLYKTRSGGNPTPPSGYGSVKVLNEFWTRMAFSSNGFQMVAQDGHPHGYTANSVISVVPAFCL